MLTNRALVLLLWVVPCVLQHVQAKSIAHCHVIPSPDQLVFANVHSADAVQTSPWERFYKREKRSKDENLIANKRLAILPYFHSSFYSLPQEIVTLYETNLIPAAIHYWENSLSLKYPHSPLHLGRFCDPSQSESNKSPQCESDCADETRCGDYIPIPEEHLDVCHYCSRDGSKCHQKGRRHKGVNADFILYISSVDSEHCRVSNTVAFSSYCQLESKYNRPVAGYINICPKSVSTKKSDINAALATLKHEILHSLGFSVGLFAFFVDKNGSPLTTRDPRTGKPPFNKATNLYEASEQVIKTIVRKNWKIGSGLIDRNVTLMVTPRVKAEVQKHFNCSSLEGAELEDQGETGTRLTHWEKRILEQEAMTGTYTHNSVFSRITFAFLEDTGWYNVNYSNAEELRWGRNLGCEFAKKSCKHWIDSRMARNQSIRPYCNQISDSHRYETLKYECDDKKEAVMLCNLIKHNHSLPPEYQNFNKHDHIEFTRRHEEKHGSNTEAALKAAHHLGGSVLLADHCPFMQQVSWSVDGDIRDSKCTIEENKPSDRDKNYILEEYGAQSKCFLHDREWSVITDRCQSKITVSKTVGCYQYICDPDEGLLVKVNGELVKCPSKEMIVNFTVISSQYLKTLSIYHANIVCPSCDEICQGKIDCEKVSKSLTVDEKLAKANLLSSAKTEEQHKNCLEELSHYPVESKSSPRGLGFSCFYFYFVFLFLYFGFHINIYFTNFFDIIAIWNQT